MQDTDGNRYVWDEILRQWVPITGAMSPAELANEMDPVLRGRFASGVLYRSQAFGGSIQSDNLIAGYSGNVVASDLGAATISGGGALGRENIIGGDITQIGTHPLDNGGTAVVNSATNTSQTGTGADYSIIGGGYNNIAGGLASVINGFHCGTGLTTTHGTIAGGSWNHISGTSDYATIGGGTANRITGASDFSVIAGGDSNQITDAAYALVAGQNNSVTSGGSGAAVLGTANTVSGASSVALGQLHTVASNYSVAMGRGAVTRSLGHIAFSSQERAAAGDSQGGIIVVRRQTTDATATILGVAGGNTAHTVRDGQAIAFRAIVIAREAATGDCKQWEVIGLVKKETGNNSTFIGTPTVTSSFASAGAAAWAVTTGAASSTGAWSLRGAGEAGKTIQWVARIDMVEVVA